MTRDNTNLAKVIALQSKSMSDVIFSKTYPVILFHNTVAVSIN